MEIVFIITQVENVLQKTTSVMEIFPASVKAHIRDGQFAMKNFVAGLDLDSCVTAPLSRKIFNLL